MPEDPKHDVAYGNLARNLADALMRFARDRRLEDKKEIAEAHHALCRMRRQELEEEPVAEG